jgi:hypothetical protein
MNRLVLATIALLSLGGCRKEPPHIHTPVKKVRAPRTIDSLSYHPAPADSTFFDPNGYYFPTTLVSAGALRLRFIEVPALRLSFSDTTAPNDEIMGFCSGSVERDTVSLNCRDTPIGHVTIQGTFMDKRGSFWNQRDVRPQQTVVLRAVVIVFGPNGPVSRPVLFTYWQGD